MKYPVNPVWQPLYKAEQCSAKICRREYSSVFEKRDHCYSCGKIYCKRCIKVYEKDQRLCENCSKSLTL